MRKQFRRENAKGACPNPAAPFLAGVVCGGLDGVTGGGREELLQIEFALLTL